MELNIQIYSFIYSFLFGGIFYFLLDLFSRISCKVKKIIKAIFSVLFILLIAISYFLGLLFINNGVVHIYFLLSILVGYIFVYKVFMFLFTHLRKK